MVQQEIVQHLRNGRTGDIAIIAILTQVDSFACETGYGDFVSTTEPTPVAELEDDLVFFYCCVDVSVYVFRGSLAIPFRELVLNMR